MIVTVTLNPAIDKTVVISNFCTGSVNRVQSIRTDVGGKGINVSKCLEILGAESTAAAFLGGAAGMQCSRLLAQTHIVPLILQIPGETRTNTKIIDPLLQQNTDINEPGPEIEPALLIQLRDAIAARLREQDIVVLSGSLPKGAPDSLYYEWAMYFKRSGARVFLDADGMAFRRGLEAQPDMVKPNREELSAYMGRKLQTQEELIAAGLQLLDTGVGRVVISCGANGAIFLSKDGVFTAAAPKVPIQSTVGAGDSMVAALAFGMEKKLDELAQIRLAIAISAASVMCSGTQAPQLALVRELEEKIIVEEILQ